jgi:hypothetical protein
VHIYSNPDDRTLKTAPPVLVNNPHTGALILPTIEAIFLRQIYGWYLLRAKSLCVFSGYSLRTCERILPEMCEKGWIKSLGRPVRGRRFRVGGEIYSMGSHAPSIPPFPSVPRLRTREYDGRKLYQDTGIVTSHGLILPAHHYCAAEAAAWITRSLWRQNQSCLVIPEQVLRKVYGWYYEKDDQDLLYFCTRVPDAYVMVKGVGFRLEVQVSDTSVKNIRDVCEASPLHEPVFYVVTSDELFQRFKPLLEEFPHFLLARLWNQEDLGQMAIRFTALGKSGKLRRWWLRDYYARPCFAYAAMKAAKAKVFCTDYASSPA